MGSNPSCMNFCNHVILNSNPVFLRTAYCFLAFTVLFRLRVVSPVVDTIHPDTFQYEASSVVRGGFNWGLHFSWEGLPSYIKVFLTYLLLNPYQSFPKKANKIPISTV